MYLGGVATERLSSVEQLLLLLSFLVRGFLGLGFGTRALTHAVRGIDCGFDWCDWKLGF